MADGNGGISVEDQRRRHIAHLAGMLPGLIGRLSWSRDQIEAHRLAALREMLVYAKANSPWHRDRLSGMDPSRFEYGDLRRLPTMDKAALMADWDRIVTIPGATLAGAEDALRRSTDQFYVWGDHVLLASGGTGGRPGVFVYDWEAMAANWGGVLRSMIAVALQRGDGPGPARTAVIGAERSAHGSYTIPRTFSDSHAPVLQVSAWRSIDDVAPELEAFQPEALSCYPTLMPTLAKAKADGRLRIEPKTIFFGSEHLSDANRQLASATWPSAHVFTCWATSEGSGTFPCPLGDGFHVCEDHVVIEPVDEAGEPVADGELSHGVYLTNMINRALPLLRYYIDDIFQIDPEPCRCGLAYTKVKQVYGRGFEKFTYGGVTVHPLALELPILEQPSILEYQIEQTRTGVKVHFRADGWVDTARIETGVLSALRSYGVQRPTVELGPVDASVRTPAGKLKRFVPLRH